MADAIEGETCGLRRVTGRTVLFSLIAFFGVISVVNGVMIHAAISTFGGVETASSYQAGLAFAHELEAAQSQEALHWKVDGKFHVTAGVTLLDIDARDAAGKPLSGLEARAWLSHPTDRRFDRDLTLREAPSGHFAATVGNAPGQWDLLIEFSRDGDRLFRSRNRVVLR
jgi:nitrogen fixation protein FixH